MVFICCRGLMVVGLVVFILGKEIEFLTLCSFIIIVLVEMIYGVHVYCGMSVCKVSFYFSRVVEKSFICLNNLLFMNYHYPTII